MKKTNAIWLCAILVLSALILSGYGLPLEAFASPSAANEIKNNIVSSPEPTKIRILGATMFSFAILTTIIVVSREIRLSQPKKQKILSKYYRT